MAQFFEHCSHSSERTICGLNVGIFVSQLRKILAQFFEHCSRIRERAICDLNVGTFVSQLRKILAQFFEDCSHSNLWLKCSNICFTVEESFWPNFSRTSLIVICGLNVRTFVSQSRKIFGPIFEHISHSNLWFNYWNIFITIEEKNCSPIFRTLLS